MQSIAIIITGQLSRNSKNFYLRNFLNKTKKFDLFISTYNKDSEFVDLFNKSRIKYLNYEDFQKLKKKSYSINGKYYKLESISSPLYQWYHLNKIIEDNINILKTYDIIIKIRPDMLFQSIDFLTEATIHESSIYAFTDCLFYGKSDHFIKVFSDFYINIFKIYSFSNNKYLKINYSNLLASDITFEDPNNIKRMNLPSFLIDNTVSKTKKLIKKNINKLNKNNFNKEENFIIKKNSDKIFSSERSFLYQVINKGYLKNSNLKCCRPRRFFNSYLFNLFPYLDQLLFKFKKNLLYSKVSKIINK